MSWYPGYNNFDFFNGFGEDEDDDDLNPWTQGGQVPQITQARQTRPNIQTQRAPQAAQAPRPQPAPEPAPVAAAAPAAATAPPDGQVSCVACMEDVPATEACRAPCGHHFCREDINALFRNSISGDETSYPPRCHGPIPLEIARPLLDPALARQFATKKEELDDTNRLYCHVPTCAAYIRTALRTRTSAICPRCRASTCVICKGATHRGDCPADPNVRATEELARREGWQRCPRCNRMIELRDGCNHMQCPCGSEFCYICRSSPWEDRQGNRTCRCPQYGRPPRPVQPAVAPRIPAAPGTNIGLQALGLWAPNLPGRARPILPAQPAIAQRPNPLAQRPASPRPAQPAPLIQRQAAAAPRAHVNLPARNLPAAAPPARAQPIVPAQPAIAPRPNPPAQRPPPPRPAAQPAPRPAQPARTRPAAPLQPRLAQPPPRQPAAAPARPAAVAAGCVEHDWAASMPGEGEDLCGSCRIAISSYVCANCDAGRCEFCVDGGGRG